MSEQDMSPIPVPSFVTGVSGILRYEIEVPGFWRSVIVSIEKHKARSGTLGLIVALGVAALVYYSARGSVPFSDLLIPAIGTAAAAIVLFFGLCVRDWKKQVTFAVRNHRKQTDIRMLEWARGLAGEVLRTNAASGSFITTAIAGLILNVIREIDGQEASEGLHVDLDGERTGSLPRDNNGAGETWMLRCCAAIDRSIVRIKSSP